MKTLLLVAFGGGIGAIFRFSITLLVIKLHRPAYISTIIVNCIGSFFMGITIHMTVDQPIVANFIMAGILGGFTTFSTFSFDAFKFLETRNYTTFIIYCCSTIIVSFVAIIIGYTI